MASGRIKGITIEIDGNTTPLQKALAGVDKSLKTTDASLRDVNKLLKLDPSNVDLLKQKQEYLGSAIKDVKEKLRLEQEAYEQLKNADPSEENAEKQKALEREIIDTNNALKKYQTELDDTEDELKGVKKETDKAADATDDLEKETGQAEDAQEGANQGWTAAKQILADLVEKGIELAIQAVKRLAEEMVQAVQDAADFADEILTLEHQTHLSTDTLQEFQYMAELVDVSLDTVTGSLTKLTNNMQTAAEGSGAAADAFAALGVDVTDSEGHLRSAESVFYDVIDALGDVQNETERDAYAMDIFGRSAQDLNPLIDAGSEALEDFADEAHDMGYVLDREALESLGDMDDSFERVQRQMEAVRNQIVVAMAPAITNIADRFQEWAQNVDWDLVAEKITEIMDIVIQVVDWVIDHKELVLGIIGAITAAIIALTVAQWAMNAAFMASGIGGIIMLISALVVAVIALEKKFHVFSRFFKAVWEGIKAVVRNVVDAIKSFFRGAYEVITSIWSAITGFFSGIWEGVKAVFAAVGDFFLQRFQAAYDFVVGIWQGITGFFSSMWEGIKSIFSHVAEFFTTVFEGAKNVVSTIIGGIVAVIKAPINGVIGLINLFIRGLNRIRIPDWVPGIGGLGIHINELSYLARGGILKKGQMGFLEGSGAEAVVPLDQNQRWVHAVAMDMAREMGTNQTINITVNAAAGQSETVIADIVMRKMQQAVDRRGAVYA